MRKEATFSWYVLVVLTLAIIIFFWGSLPAPTGRFLYQEIQQQKTWDFNNSAEYVYNRSAVNVTTGAVSLIPQITTISWTTRENLVAGITSAVLRNPSGTEERTSDVIHLDGSFVTLQKGNAILDVTFNSSLQNGDVVSLYLLQGNNVHTVVRLCSQGQNCSSPGYGEISFDEKEGWYNISLSGLPSGVQTLAIDPPQLVKIDQIAAVTTVTVEHTATNTSYPFSAAVETADFIPVNWHSWDAFSALAELNGESMVYYYSPDGGVGWQQLPADGNVSGVNSSSVRLKAVLSSTGVSTPLLRQMNLKYRTRVQLCDENWAVQYTACTINDIRVKYYLDQNNCGTTMSLPADHNSSVNCDYCVPQWKEANASCTAGNTFTLGYYDVNGCYALTRQESDFAAVPPNATQLCDYCQMYNCSASMSARFNMSSLLNSTTWVVNARETTGAALEVTSPWWNQQEEIAIIDYARNVWNSTPRQKKEMGKYIDIQSSKVDNVSAVKIVIYYTDEDIAAASLDEKTLEVYYYNETSGQWQTLPSAVNTSGNYVSAVADHLSVYGIFGQGQEGADDGGSSVTSSGGGSGGGGGGHSSASDSASQGTITAPAVGQQAEQPLPVRGEAVLAESSPLVEVSCKYAVEINLPEEISFVEQHSYEGSMMNGGDCTLSFVQLYLSPELSALIELSPSSISNFTSSSSSTFTLIRKQQKQEKFFSFLTSSVVGNALLRGETVHGMLIVESSGQQEELFRKELPFSVTVLSPLDIKSPPAVKLLIVAGVLIVLTVGVGVYLFVRSRK